MRGTKVSYIFSRKSLKHRNNGYLLKKGGWFQADIYLMPFQRKVVVAKDYSVCPSLVRWVAKAFLIKRELEIYRRLGGISGIPRVYGALGKYGFILEYKEGRTLSKFRPNELPKEFFDQLEQIIHQMHQRGIVHCDIRRKNILVSHQYQPWVIDFNTSFDKGGKYNPVKRFFFPLFCQMDQQAFLKLKSSLAPSLLTDEEKACLENEVLLHRLGRWLRKGIYRKVKRQWKKRTFFCPPALHAWEREYSSDPNGILLNMVRGLMFRGYTREKIIKIGIRFNINQGSIIKDKKELADYIQDCYYQVLKEFREKNCLDSFCSYFTQQGYCKQDDTEHCKWRLSYRTVYYPIKDDF